VPARAWPWMWSWWPATATAALNRNRNLSTGRRLVGLPAQAVAPGAAGQAGGRAHRDPCGRDRRAQRRATPHRTESARWREGPSCCSPRPATRSGPWRAPSPRSSRPCAHRPDVAVLNVRMPPGFRDEGLRAAQAHRQRIPQALPAARRHRAPASPRRPRLPEQVTRDQRDRAACHGAPSRPGTAHQACCVTRS
jgi:hypothetical protein